MTGKQGRSVEWNFIQPEVNSEAEFLEIIHDFGDPLELLREAISNAIDAQASEMEIKFSMEKIDGLPRLAILVKDNGRGMTKDVIERDFWGLGYSRSRDKKENPDAIGEKGHGTKIYLRSDLVYVKTQSSEGSYESQCENPMKNLNANKMHKPVWRKIDPFLGKNTGTEITIVGYNDNERSRFKQKIVKDYLLWFTKMGSIEKVFDIGRLSSFRLKLQCLDAEEYEVIPFGHVFPEENKDLDKLLSENLNDPADWYVKKYRYKNLRLDEAPEVAFDLFVSVEGDAIKRAYNPMLGKRNSKASSMYKVSDRYGLWLCKDYIPVKRVNEWISGFGSGSNAIVLLHGFVNCQALKLTANRGDIANTDVKVLEELKKEVQKCINKINDDLDSQGIYALTELQEEQKTIQQENKEFNRRTKNIKDKRFINYKGTKIFEPTNESELFGLFMIINTLHADLFPFEPFDYNTSKGIDIIGKNKDKDAVTDGQYWYIELKYMLNTKRFNHAFKHIKYILCWDFEKSISSGTALQGVEEKDVREIMFRKDATTGKFSYFLDSSHANRVFVIRMKEYLKQNLDLDFDTARSE